MADAEAVLRELDIQPLTTPVEALLRTAAELVALKDWLGGRFAEASAADQFALAELFGRGLERCSKLLVELHKLDLEARQAKLDHRMSLLIADAVSGMIRELGIDVTDHEVGKVVRRHMLRVAVKGYEPKVPFHSVVNLPAPDGSARG
jgi:hypothetical protein